MSSRILTLLSRVQRARLGKWGGSSGNRSLVGQYENLSQGTLGSEFVYNSLTATYLNRVDQEKVLHLESYSFYSTVKSCR